MSKLDQLRALRERQFLPTPTEMPLPAKTEGGFDKRAYQREYMRRWRAEHASETPTELYRHFDAEGHLLYVGVSTDAHRRSKQHQARAEWWPSVARTEITYYPTLPEALAAEARAILGQKPIHNKRGTVGLIAPPGECPHCDERRVETAERVRRHRHRKAITD